MISGSIYALLAGCLGATASLSAKLTLGADYLKEMCEAGLSSTSDAKHDNDETTVCLWVRRTLSTSLNMCCAVPSFVNCTRQGNETAGVSKTVLGTKSLHMLPGDRLVLSVSLLPQQRPIHWIIMFAAWHPPAAAVCRPDVPLQCCHVDLLLQSSSLQLFFCQGHCHHYWGQLYLVGKPS